MRKNNLYVVVLLYSLLAFCTPVAMAADFVIIKSCGFEGSGDACVFDVVATEHGVLAVDTKATTGGERWKASIAEMVDSPVPRIDVGSGSTTKFSGRIARGITMGKIYQVKVIYDSPLPGVFPTSATVRFTGPVDFPQP